MKKKTNIRAVIRKIVREEVAMAIKEVVTELKVPSLSSTQPKSTRKIVEKKQYTNNSILNDVLNETAQTEEWKTMGGETYDSSKMNNILSSQYSDIGVGNKIDVNQMAVEADVNPESVPDHVEKAITRDYSDLMKAINNKGGDDGVK